MVDADEFTHNVSFKTCHLAKWFDMIIILSPLVEIATVQIKKKGGGVKMGHGCCLSPQGDTGLSL